MATSPANAACCRGNRQPLSLNRKGPAQTGALSLSYSSSLVVKLLNLHQIFSHHNSTCKIPAHTFCPLLVRNRWIVARNKVCQYEGLHTSLRRNLAHVFS